MFNASMRRLGVALFLLLAGNVYASSKDTAWRADLDFLTRELPSRHKNAFFHTSRQTFETAAATLREEIPSLQDHQVVVRMMRLVALIGDAHTNLYGYPFSRLPIRAYWFDDHLFVTRATSAHHDLLGLRIVAVNDRPIEEVSAALATIISHENDSWLRSQLPAFLTMTEVLETLGIISSTASATFRFASNSGESITRTLVAMPFGSSAEWSELPDPRVTTLPLYRRSPELNYWYEYLPAHATIYLKYNRCQEIASKPFNVVGTELAALMSSYPVERLILDMRNNGGGASSVLQPLILGIQAFPDLNRPDRFFVIIGRETFSSALLNAIQLQQQTNATLVGESTGGKPNAYGEVLNFTLPQSGLTVGYSTKYFQMMPGEDPASLDPEIPIGIKASDYFAGRDSVLDTLLPPIPRRRSVSH